MRTAAVTLLCAMFLLPPGPASSEPSAPEPAVAVAPGVSYRRIVQDKQSRVVHVLTVDVSKPAEVDVVLAGDPMPGYDLPSRMVRDAGAVAGVNGDFGVPPGRPGHLMAIDGELVQTSVLGDVGRGFAVRSDETGAYIGRPRPRIVFRGPPAVGAIHVARWNEGAPRAGEVAGYSRFGGTVSEPPTDACSVRLIDAGDPVWAPDQRGIVRSHTVDAVRCGSAAMELQGGTVLAARPGSGGADQINLLSVGDAATLEWGVGWPGVLDVIGGSAVLLQDGIVAVQACTRYLCLRHPRTAVGVTAENKILMVVVDGRSFRSGGATIVGLAKLMKSLGAVDALNLDGGGSSTMVVGGKVVNTPSDGHERAVTSALVVLPTADGNDPL